MPPSGNSRAVLLSLLLTLPAGTYSAQSTGSNAAAETRDHLQRAQAALTANDAETAAKEFRALVMLDPKNANAHANLGVLAIGKGDCRTASREFRSALAIQPSLMNAKALLGICAKRLGENSAPGLLEDAFAKLKDPKLRTQVGLELAGLYYQKGEPDHAAPVMGKLVDLNSDDPEILFMAQRIYSELADDTLNKLAVVAPGSARMQQIIAERLINAGDLKGAIDHYGKALEIDPRLPGVHYELGEAILESSPTEPAAQAEAEKEFEAAIKMEGDSAKIECELGRIANLRSDMEQAYAHYNRAYTLDPREVQAQMGLGKLLAIMDKPQEAMKFLRMAVQSDPLNGEAHYRLATLCRKLELKDEADKELRLFQEIKKTKERVRELYRQMNKRTREQDDQMSDVKP